MRLGSGVAVAVAVAGSYGFDSTPRLGTSICLGCSPKKTKKRKDIEVRIFHVRMSGKWPARQREQSKRRPGRAPRSPWRDRGASAELFLLGLEVQEPEKRTLTPSLSQ